MPLPSPPPGLQLTAAHLPDSRQGGWVAIQRNRVSGAGKQYRPIMDLIRELQRSGMTPRLFGSRDQLDRSIRMASSPPRAIVAAGGDGTLADLVNRHPLVPIAVLPLGTENLVARHYGIPRRDGDFVARMIAAGHTRTIDLGEIGGRKFILMASCGFDATVLHRAHAARNGSITQLHYLKPLLRTLWDYRYPTLKVYCDHDTAPLEGGMAFIANLPTYALGMPLSPRSIDDDGQFHVRIFQHRSRWQMVWDVLQAHWHGGHPWSGCIDRTATHVRIETSEPVAVQADGDPAGMTPVELSILPAAGLIVVPGGTASQ